jgi:AraC-like DNA-binding protein
VNPDLLVLQDFHLRGGGAPEWNQRYLQMSPGVMRSTLHAWSAACTSVFRKWMSERVVQQGGLPRGQLCFALLADDPDAGMRVQGRDFDARHLLVLHGGQEFEFQRPAGVELLSVTFRADAFSGFLEQSPEAGNLCSVPAAAVIHPDPVALAALRQLLRAQVSTRRAAAPADLMQSVRDVLAGGGQVPRQRASRVVAATMVRECQHIALTEICEQPLRIEELCRRLHTSRRTLQNSFREVTDASPVVYLRNLRLNAARRRLMATSATDLSVSHAALEAGFDHLGHFAQRYRALFREAPSRTVRLPAQPRKVKGRS